MKDKEKQVIKYDFLEVQPLVPEDTKGRIWQIVYAYRKGKLIAEGRAACCLADIKDELFDVEQGYEIATGRARIAVEKKRSYGRLPEGYYKGAYYGAAPKTNSPFPMVGMAVAAGLMARHNQPKFCPSCGEKLPFGPVKPPIESLITSNIEDIKKAARKCARRR